MKIKVFTSIFTAVFLFGLLLMNTSYASGKDTEILKGNRVQISVTNDQTGESTFLDPIETGNIKSLSINSDNDSLVESYEFFIPMEVFNASNITPFTDQGGTKTDGGVTATLSANYDLNSSGDKVRVNKVSGSWTPSSNIFIVSDREVNAHSSTYWGQKLTETPSSNTFSYTTNWDYNTRVLGDGGPRAWSSAKIVVSGMSGTSHTIEVDFNFAN